ncbi:MAG TPA: hypothetical protein VGA56_04090 [Opitutaceae bacterium]
MDWNVARWDLRRRFPDLSEDDLAYIEQRMNQIMDRIALSTGRHRDEVKILLRGSDSSYHEDDSGYPVAPDIIDESGIPENTSQSGTSALSM